MTISDEERYLRTAFLERIAHELRGPTGVVQGSIDELEHALGADAEKYRTLLAVARRGLARVLRTASRLDQTAQLDGGTARFEPGPADAGEVARKAVAEAEGLEARRKIRVEVRAPDDPLPCRLDARWMGVALRELASNAIRHATQNVFVEITADADAVRVEITDDNPAPHEFAPVRFRPTREGRGLGLGLAIASDVVVAHDGELAIETPRPGAAAGGTRVRVTLPRAGTGKSPTPTPEPSTS